MSLFEISHATPVLLRAIPGALGFRSVPVPETSSIPVGAGFDRSAFVHRQNIHCPLESRPTCSSSLRLLPPHPRGPTSNRSPLSRVAPGTPTDTRPRPDAEYKPPPTFTTGSETLSWVKTNSSDLLCIKRIFVF